MKPTNRHTFALDSNDVVVSIVQLRCLFECIYISVVRIASERLNQSERELEEYSICEKRL